MSLELSKCYMFDVSENLNHIPKVHSPELSVKRLPSFGLMT